MYNRQLLKATIIILGILAALTVPASAGAVTYTFDAGNATNATIENGIWITSHDYTSFTIPLLISTAKYVYGYTAGKTSAASALQIIFTDAAAWQSNQTAGKISASVSAGTAGPEIIGTNKSLVNVTVSTNGLADGSYTVGLNVESAYSAYPQASVSLPSLTKEAQTKSFIFRFGTLPPTPTLTPTPVPTPKPTRSPGGGGGVVPTVIPPTLTPTLTPTVDVTESQTKQPETTIPTQAVPTPNESATGIPLFAIILGIAGIIVLVLLFLLIPIVFPKVVLHYNERTTTFRTLTGKVTKEAIMKHAPDFPAEGWYSNEEKTEPWDEDRRIRRKLVLWHRG